MGTLSRRLRIRLSSGDCRDASRSPVLPSEVVAAAVAKRTEHWSKSRGLFWVVSESIKVSKLRKREPPNIHT